MLCDKYKEVLMEVAAKGATMPVPVREHVDACAACGAGLTEKKALFAAVDAGLHNTANAEVPSSFLLNVKASLPVESVRARNLIPGLGFVCASGALLLAIAFLSLLHRGQERALTEAVTVASEAPADARGTWLNSVSQRKTPHPARVSKARAQQNVSVANHEPEVLVPPGEEEFLRRYYTRLGSPARDIKLVVADEHELTPKPLVISQIEVKELKIESMEERLGFQQTNTK